ncbi:7-carboxy-7-deazaguanine synthase QueE [Falsirhodobacter algicola]|uniref:7-carboxy-7-deazaguanine synthase n=1 Tax=Falsirhodobacter algicola TaxID=2692330 RepID=A0A8J8SM61_9RHOB|nr:7-carboxy-7-deazaguanine synthase QueE [Falsirhodobacter algicola]QUS37076.1 7-carboxy-7-deazaguanine synthase QueE [Falsirhodobacter algicola]
MGRVPAMIRVSEIFGPTIQGEGALIGLPTVFVRTGGCDYRCSWCDSLHAVDSAFRHTWVPMTAEAILGRIAELSGGRGLMVSLSGGNPAIQPLAPLIAAGHAQGYRFALETQGSIAQDWFADLDWLVLSPKPPSSGETVDWDRFAACLVPGPQVVMKIVIFDEADYAFARDAARRFPDLPLYLQPGNPVVEETATPTGLNERMLWLVDRVVQDGWFAPRILPQLHVILWGNKRGV